MRIIKASNVNKSRRQIKSATSIGDMISAFEDKLEEFELMSKTDVNCKEDITCDREVEIYEEDYYDRYKDVGGKFGKPGEVYTLGQIKEMWNSNDSCEFKTFDDYWRNTKDNFFIEASDNVCGSEEYIKGDKTVEVMDSDYSQMFKDDDGGLGEVDTIYSLAELKEIWNSSYDTDPVMESYDSFVEWLTDTLDYMTEVAEDSFSKEVVIDDDDYNTYYTDTNGMFGQDEHSAGEVYSLGEIKHYWNTNYDKDYVLSSYDSFDDWWRDTSESMELVID